jgi:hypothetical protein
MFNDHHPVRHEHRLRQRGAFVCLLAALCLTACGGGGGGDGDGASSACERVSAGPTDIVVRNQLATGLRASFDALAFGTDMLAGECNTVGFDAGNRPTMRVELQQCSNVSTNSDCTGLLFGPTRTVDVSLLPGDPRTVVVDAATFR